MNNELGSIVQVIQIIGYIIVVVVFVVMIKADNKVIRVQIDAIHENIKVLNTSFGRIGDLLTKIAVQEQRMAGLEQDVRELRHGEGFVRGTKGIEREYGEGK